MIKVNVATLKAELSKYLELARTGSEVVVTSHGHEIAKLSPSRAATNVPAKWSELLKLHPPLRPKKTGLGASTLIRKIRDED